MRMDADGGVEPREPVDEGERTVAARLVPARNEDPLDAGDPCAADDEVDVGREPVGLEMAVAVDQARARSGAFDAQASCQMAISLPSESVTTVYDPMPGTSWRGWTILPPARSTTGSASSSDVTVM
jgi:hypothetical protein